MDEEILKNAVRRQGLKGERGSFHPDEIELAEYLEGTLSRDRGERICEHIISCDSCFKKLADAERTFSLFNEKEAESPPAHIEKKAKMIAKRFGRTNKAKNHFKKNKFFYFAAISLVFSFISKRYFAQFLAVAVILGFKWVMDTGGSKALIMIYQAWKTSHR